ncbi:hypothetical protein Lser_V15G06111 [Lactuca serriola]
MHKTSFIPLESNSGLHRNGDLASWTHLNTIKVSQQAKKVYLEGLTKDWNEEKVKEICKKYGEILRVDTCLNPRSKNKDFGFITFASNVNDLARVTQVYKVYQEEEEQLFSCSKEDNRISEAMRLCLHNNAAIAASAAQAAGAKKVLIVY